MASALTVANTPVEKYRIGKIPVFVKREDLCTPNPGPPFSKTRGLAAFISSSDAKQIGVLDTYHSYGGWAVAYVCKKLGRKAVVFYPEFKNDPGYRLGQKRAEALGAEIIPLPAGRSAILYRRARSIMMSRNSS